jgi:2',3'-cyclic-nucleotide 2'-phosphodiesterase (5'-nucleotidase family)
MSSELSSSDVGALSESAISIIFTGEENGYLEPCGCSTGELGGLPRRHTLINRLRNSNENCVLLSLGDISREVGRQGEIKMEITLKALDQMGYFAHNIGEKDINMGLELLGYLSQTSDVNFISSNIVFLNSPGINVRPYVIKEIETKEATVKIGILGILSPELVDDDYQNIEVLDPIVSLKNLLSDLNGKADILVLLSHAKMDDSVKLVEIFPELDLIISGHGVDEPVLYLKRINNTSIVPVGEKGRHLGVITFPLEYGPGGKTKHDKTSIPNSRLEYYGLGTQMEKSAVEIILVDERFENSPEIERLLKIYQQRLKDEELLKRVFKVDPPSNLTFIGNDDCAICHNKIFRHWAETRHASAYETLVRVEHEYDPECVSCHTIGLHYFTGFETIESTPKLKGVGCESCHGPGSSHKETQSKDYGSVNADSCITCHEDEHSPNFQFEEYWQKIVHPPEDK